MHTQSQTPPFVGVIPGGGAGTRLGSLPYSKELVVVGVERTQLGLRPRLACEPLLHGLQSAGVSKILWVLDRSKVDIIRHFGGALNGTPLTYLPTDASPSVVHTLACAASELRDRYVLFGFPDIVFEPSNALEVLANELAPKKGPAAPESAADVVLGVVPSPPRVIADRVRLDAEGYVEQVLVKPPGDVSPHVWLLAAWSPLFTQFLTDFLMARPTETRSSKELYLGHVVQAAIEGGLRVRAAVFPKGSFIDTGTPEGLSLAQAGYAR